MALDDQDIRYLNAKFDTVHETLNRIDEQVQKTNGRVDAHDVRLTKLQWINPMAIVLGVVVLYLVAMGVIPPNAFK